jgi:hypothetical protein
MRTPRRATAARGIAISGIDLICNYITLSAPARSRLIELDALSAHVMRVSFKYIFSRLQFLQIEFQQKCTLPTL